MLEDIKGIKIKGRKYSSETDFLFWEKQSDKETRITLLYGRNGSGKSTVSEAFDFIRNPKNQDFENLELISQTSVTDDDKKYIHVFNEKFIDSKIKIEETGISSIVMFGEQVDLDDQIKKKEDELTKKTDDVDKQNSLVEEYKNSQNEKSPQFYLNKCMATLKQNQGWANIDSKIKGNRQNSQVSQTTVTDIATKYTSDKSLIELNQLYHEKKSLFDSVTNGSNEITSQVFLIPYDDFDSKAKLLLLKRIEQVELTEREKRIFSFIEENGQELLTDSKLFFSNEENNFCPYCYQSISKEYKINLMHEFQKVLNEEVEEYQNQLDLLKQKEVSINLDLYNQLDTVSVQAVKIEVDKFNKVIEKFNDLIKMRKNNVYQVFQETDYTIYIKDAVISLNASLKQLEDKRKEFNNVIKNKSSLKNELIEVNNKIANKNIFDDYQKYQTQLTNQEAEIQKLTLLANERDVINNDISDLEEQKKSIKIAQEHINYLLKYVFFSEKKIAIESHNGSYEIKSQGQSVKPKQISCGERNILALCYYFTELFNGKEKTKIYSDPNLLIIDDPVSSFDKENRVGVLSLLKYELQHFISGNEETKVLIMTHDLMAFYDMEKIAKEIIKSKSFVYSLYEFSKNNIQKFEYKKANEYSNLLCQIYDYCIEDDTEDTDLNIGNVIRRVVEAYSTFVYKVGIDEISYDTKILSTLETQKERDYFENLMYRLVLNGESHFKERVKSLEDFCNGISIEEKKRTAKDVLCFLYLLNPIHIQKHLKEPATAIEKIEEWCNAINA